MSNGSDSTKFKRFGDGGDRLPDGGYTAADEFDPVFDHGAMTTGGGADTIVPDAPGSRRLKPGTVLPVGTDYSGANAVDVGAKPKGS